MAIDSVLECAAELQEKCGIRFDVDGIRSSVEEIMKREDYWHADLCEMIPMVKEYYELIQSKGMAEAYGVILGM